MLQVKTEKADQMIFHSLLNWEIWATHVLKDRQNVVHTCKIQGKERQIPKTQLNLLYFVLIKCMSYYQGYSWNMSHTITSDLSWEGGVFLLELWTSYYSNKREWSILSQKARQEGSVEIGWNRKWKITERLRKEVLLCRFLKRNVKCFEDFSKLQICSTFFINTQL